MANLQITASTPDEHEALVALYPEAFPEEDLTALVRALLAHGDVMSLTARLTGQVVGHALFSLCGVSGSDHRVALLGPLCVAPMAQHQGVGRELIETGADRLAEAEIRAILVLGDPEYYVRMGFDAISPIEAPYPLKPEWAEAWRMRPLQVQGPAAGVLEPPAPWLQAELWR